MFFFITSSFLNKRPPQTPIASLLQQARSLFSKSREKTWRKLYQPLLARIMHLKLLIEFIWTTVVTINQIIWDYQVLWRF